MFSNEKTVADLLGYISQYCDISRKKGINNMLFSACPEFRRNRRPRCNLAAQQLFLPDNGN
jgi:hypothetical protein